MKLTKQTDFALRTLLYLAKLDGDERVLASDIALSYGMPINHLTKIVNKLANLGYINTYRGRGGGIELAQAPKNILIRRVIEDFEPSLNPADCANCVLNKDCHLQGILAEASRAFLDSLGEKSLADMD